MRREPDSELVAALTRALRAETDVIQPSPDARAEVQARVAEPQRRGSAGIEDGRPRGRARPVWLGPVAAVVALGLVVVGLLFVTTDGLHRTAAPGPARSPSEAPTAAPTASAASTPEGRTTASGGFRPSQPRVAWTVYRPGPDGLYVDAAPAQAPYDPVQAMDALFQQSPTVPGAEVVPRSSSNRVASLTYVDHVIHLDMASVDEETRPTGPEGAAQARRWVASWVRTLSDAYRGGGQVLITLDGKPTTLYGVVDTSKPMFELMTIPVEHPATLYFPAEAASVTSPVAVAAMPSAVGDRLVVRDASRAAVSSVTADAGGGGETVLTFAPELAPGEYTVDLVLKSGKTVPQRRFTVTGTEPTGARMPVTDPQTSSIATTFIYYPGRGQQLLAEPRPRTTLAEAVAGISGEPSGDDASWPFGSLTLASVRADGDEVVVDYSGDDGIRPGKPDAALATFWAQSLVRTVSAYEGHAIAVRVTLQGRPFRLFGLLDTSKPFVDRSVDVRTTEGVALPDSVPKPGPLQVVGAAGADVDHVTWYVIDRMSDETLYQGNAPVADDRTYAFALTVPAGRYELRVDAVSAAGRVLASYGRSPEVT